MDQCLLFLLLLLMGRNGLCQQEEVCSKSVINSCNDCIRSGPYCVWCQQLNFTKAGEQEAARCDTQTQLIARGCKMEEIISPKDHLIIVKNDPLSNSFKQQESVQLTPQKIQLILRPELPITFRVSFKRVQGYPVDLYYLMDLSYSMKDDLENVKELGQDLFAALNKITGHAQIGFGAFVDKTVLPYTNTNKKKLQKPCDDNDQQCQAAFGYRHVLSMTPREDEFKIKVKEQFISGNLDSPEGSLDAMMQAAVCGDKIGWRNSSTRLIVLTTDAGFHMAGDGKLAGILEPNDEQCHMEYNLYTKSSEMDYPSVGQLAMQLEKNNIQPIFAVTKNMETVYKQLSKMIPKSEVGVLSSNSNNVVQLIESAYNRLSSKVTVTHDNLPDNVRVTYTPICDHAGLAGDNEGVCDNVHVEQEISFNVTVTALSCMEKKSFTIRPLGIKDTLTVTLSTNCECKCDDPSDRNHTHCKEKGRVSCGICSCQEGFVGQFCECAIGDKDERTLRASCQRQNGTECEGRGDCVCGRCQCHTTESGSSYHGDFCECDDEHCEKFQNKLCGGKGKCNCDRCECNPGYEGSACQCRVSEEGCRTLNNTVCFGRGTCKCNRCECKEGYQQPRCKKCPGCPDPCQTKLNCIECLGFDSGPFKKNCSMACSKSIYHEMVNQFTKLNQQCQQKDSEGCWVKFNLEQLVGDDNYRAEILKQRDCPEPHSVTAIIGGSIASVALIGIVLLMLIKLFIYMKDLKEFRKFENEKKKSKWANADNPLFQNATTTVSNPTFTGE
ncbi:integrin beta-2 [Xiphias gladius]|uniref:integrin beta-2 n=1 Tax=Xiphias gladius TaxID=8245 RepID=UPI001A990A29|nr:integrin beta-2 [Xiphias gladius]XP_040003778.1 integrin beta-2 [Xiphias gladius]XP_040003779.1 integrin beta-2 [Xiphias gladius]XP_040003780.1 integrin beta-2 [Xiphias gladius]XP_040003781.1 integrin beta-2 [Xiphias gladius]